MPEIIFKMHGTVAYTDGSWDPIDISYQNGRIISPFTAEGLAANARLDNDSTLDVALLALVGILGNIHIGAVPAPAVAKTISDWTISLSGRLARDDGSWQDFGSQHSSGVIFSLTPDHNPAEAFNEAAADPALNAFITAALEVVMGAGTVTITAA